MKDVNKVTLMGRLGADPILRQTKNGNPVAQFSIATSRKIKGKAEAPDELVEKTQWHKVVAWGKVADSCSKYLKKGNAVYVEGMIQSHKYQDSEGQERLSFEVVAQDVSFITPRSTTESIPKGGEMAAAI